MSHDMINHAVYMVLKNCSRNTGIDSSSKNFNIGVSGFSCIDMTIKIPS